jgi:two-component system OmpR family response regulator
MITISTMGRALIHDQLFGLTHACLARGGDADVHVSRVRQKIEPNVREPTQIRTVRRGG